MDAQSRKELLGSRIRKYREAENITQERFADMVGTAQSYLSDIEAGRVNVGFDLLCRIAEGLDVSLGALGDRDPEDGRNALSLSSRSGEHGPLDHCLVTSFCQGRTRSRNAACTPGRARPRGGCRRRRPPRSRCRGISAAGLRAPPRAG